MSEAQESCEIIPLLFQLNSTGYFAQDSEDKPYDVGSKVGMNVNLLNKQISELFIVTLIGGRGSEI